MTRRIALLATALGLAAPAGSTAQAPSDDASIRAFVASFQAAWNARDAATLAGLFRADADQILGNRPATTGREAIRMEWAARLGSLAEGLTNTVVVDRIRRLGPDVAVVEATGNFKGGRTPSGVPIRASSDRALYVLQRESGAWALASFHVYEAVVEADAASAIRAARGRFVDAALRGDARAAAEVYAVNGVNIVPDIPDVRGRDAIRQGFEAFFANATVDALEFTDVALDVQPFTAHEAGTFVQTYHTRDGATVTQHGRYIAVWRREAGGPWEYARFLLNWLPAEG